MNDLKRKTEEIAHGSKLIRNTLLNLLGEGLPFFVAVFAIPRLIEGLGITRFGILTIIWMIVGYFSLFDLGIGRALTKLVAERVNTKNEHKIPGIIWTSLIFMFILSFFGVLILFYLLKYIVYVWLEIPPDIQNETYQGFKCLIFSIPIIITSIGLRSVLEAKQCFGIVNSIKIPIGIISFLGPVIVLQFSISLVPIIIVLVVSRIVGFIANFIACLYIIPSLRHSFAFDKKIILPLLGFGGWMTISNIISPIMVYMDRLFIGSILSVGTVSFYTTPYEVITKILIIPRSLGRVLFPVLSNANATNKTTGSLIYVTTAKYLFIVMCCITLPVITFAQEGLTLWLGKEFAQKSIFVAQCLTVGVLINSLGHIPFNFLQSIGRPDLSAKMHMIELPFYLLLLKKMINIYGINGAAIAWLIRVTFDTCGLFLLVHIFSGDHFNKKIKTIVLGCFILNGSIIFIVTQINSKGLKLFILLSFFMVSYCIIKKIYISDLEATFFHDNCKKISFILRNER
ncbi:MAG: flippase [Desulfobacterium sp.]|nr:flippase [Desulfobacterium sp.]